MSGPDLFGPWRAFMECTDCGATWEETDPPEGFIEMHESEKREIVDEFMAAEHRHDCGVLGYGLARCTNLMRSVDFEESMELARRRR